MGRLLVLRHAQSEWNAAGRWQGWSDLPLSALGTAQARRAGQVLAAEGVVVGALFSSDLSRARSTAVLIAEELGYERALSTDPDLREHDVGEWNGLSSGEVNARWPGMIEALGAQLLEAFPGGEKLGDFRDRVRQAVQRLALAAHAQESGDVLAVSHGGVMTVIEHWLGVWDRDRRHPNVSGWWLAPTGTPPHVALEPLMAVQLAEASSGPASPRPTSPATASPATANAGPATSGTVPGAA